MADPNHSPSAGETLLVWSRVAAMEERTFPDLPSGSTVLAWGIRIDPRNPLGRIPDGHRVIHPADLFTSDEWLGLDRDLTRWCEEWHGVANEGDWRSPGRILAAARFALRPFWGAIYQFLACLDRVASREPIREIVIPAGSSLYIDERLLEDVAADFGAARGIKVRVLPRPHQRWSALASPGATLKRILGAARWRLVPEFAGARKPGALDVLMDEPRSHPWFRDAASANPTINLYGLVPERCWPEPGVLIDAVTATRRSIKAADRAPRLLDTSLLRSWRGRWPRIAWSVVFPGVLRAMREMAAEAMTTPGSCVATSPAAIERELFRIRHPAVALYHLHHGAFTSAFEPFVPGYRHITGWTDVPESLAARGEPAEILPFPTSHVMALREAGEPPAELRREFESRRAGKRGVVVVAPSFSTPYAIFTMPDDVETMLVGLLEWIRSRPDLLFVFKLHPFSDKNHNEGRSSLGRKLALFDTLPSENRIVYCRDFSAAANRFLYENSDVLIDGYSSIIKEALLYGLPVASLDPFDQPYRYSPGMSRISSQAFRRESDPAKLTDWIDELTGSPERWETLRRAARTSAALLHRAGAAPWRTARWSLGAVTHTIATSDEVWEP